MRTLGLSPNFDFSARIPFILTFLSNFRSDSRDSFGQANHKRPDRRRCELVGPRTKNGQTWARKISQTTPLVKTRARGRCLCFRFSWKFPIMGTKRPLIDSEPFARSTQFRLHFYTLPTQFYDFNSKIDN